MQHAAARDARLVAMNDWTWYVIVYGWAVWIVYWLAMAFTARRTVERRGAIRDRLIVSIVVIAWLLIRPFGGAPAHLWDTHLALGIATDCLFVAWAAFTVWARVALGGNWSGEVAFKESHELIQTGPYGIVRHPIYTGLLAMVLATALHYGRGSGLVVFGLLCVGAWLKSRQEERLMAEPSPTPTRSTSAGCTR